MKPPTALLAFDTMAKEELNGSLQTFFYHNAYLRRRKNDLLMHFPNIYTTVYDLLYPAPVVQWL